MNGTFISELSVLLDKYGYKLSNLNVTPDDFQIKVDMTVVYYK